MPFTLAHPAAVVPLARRGWVFSALVVGSMAPDFGYFLPFLPGCSFSHTPSGAFLFGVPTGLIFLWLFHRFLKQPALSLLPTGHQSRLIAVSKEFSFTPARRFGMIVLSLAIGIMTHIAWDSFTHRHGWMVQRISILGLPILEIFNRQLRVYKALQYGCSLVGPLLLGYWYAGWFRRAPGQGTLQSTFLSPASRLFIVLLMGLVASGAALLYSWPRESMLWNLDSVQHIVIDTVQCSAALLFLESLLFSSYWHARNRRGVVRV